MVAPGVGVGVLAPEAGLAGELQQERLLRGGLEVADLGDEAERATRETENSLELRTRDRYRKLIGKIDSTLKRLEAGDYGYCVDTGEEIGLERLEARLTAERTIDAQERWEHLQKQQGD